MLVARPAPQDERCKPGDSGERAQNEYQCLLYWFAVEVIVQYSMVGTLELMEVSPYPTYSCG